ncbi:CHAT domain-containing protein [Ilyonectria destructans]|nr:CHAT domain-containing protein [Ilyonectria destructans]
MSGLDMKVHGSSEATDDYLHEDTDRAVEFHQSGVNFWEKYQQHGELQDLDEAISMARKATKAALEDDPNQPLFHSNFGHFLRERFTYSEEASFLREALVISEQAVKLTPAGHDDRPGRLINLGNALYESYYRFEKKEDLDKAIDATKEALKDILPQNPLRHIVLNSLGRFLGERFQYTSNDDLKEAVGYFRDALDIIPQEHKDYPTIAMNLGVKLEEFFSNTGEILHLDESISLTRTALSQLCPEHPGHPEIANSLASRLTKRYWTTRQFDDLEEAIQLSQDALQAASEESSVWTRIAGDLANRLGFRFSRTEKMVDLNNAIRLLEISVKRTPPEHTHRARRLNGLAVRLFDKYLLTKNVEDLEQAIVNAQEAADKAKDHWHRPGWLITLATVLRERYLRFDADHDLQSAVSASQKAVNLTPVDHPERAEWLTTLGNLLQLRYKCFDTEEDLEEAMRCYDSAVNHDVSPTTARIAAGRQLLSSPAVLRDKQQAYAYARTTIDLVLRLAPRFLRVSDMQHVLLEAAGLASDAAAIALHAGKDPLVAVQFLEAGRGVLTSSIQDLRTDVSGLAQQYPDLASSFNRLCEKLDTSQGYGSYSGGDDYGASPKTQAEQRVAANAELESLIEEIRCQPGFGHFLRPPSDVEIMNSAKEGPIVIPNVSIHRCDALIITDSEISALELPKLSHKGIIRKSEDLGSVDTLQWLWDVVVCPTLDKLRLTGPPSSNACWPRLWWIPTGPLVGFPIHAAGYHHLRHQAENALDRVVASYGSSIKAINHGRRQRHQKISAKTAQKVALVAMDKTPKFDPLPNADAEIKVIEAACRKAGLPYTRLSPYKQEVSAELETCTMFHFAGHGLTDRRNPLKSQLVLADWEQDPLTVESILEGRQNSSSPFLAFLSACGTGRTLQQMSADENLHLTSAVQLVGFRHVFGTLWEVKDNTCVEVSRMVYDDIFEKLRKGNLEDSSMSLALHHALRTLRDRWRGGSVSYGIPTDEEGLGRNAERVRGPKARLGWVPFVHFGV